MHFNTRVTDALGIDMDQYKTITPMQILDIYGRALDEGVINENFWLNFRDGGKRILWAAEQQSYLHKEDGIPRFDSPECIAYLEASQRIQTKQTGSMVMSFANNAMEVLSSANNALMFMTTTYLGSFELLTLINNVEYSSKAIPLVTEDQNNVANFIDTYAIPESSPHKELAWEFMKYCVMESEMLSYHMIDRENEGKINGDRFMGCIPINRNNFQKYIKYCSQKTQHDYTREYELLLSWMENYKGGFFEESMDFEDILGQYYDSKLITAEECAKKLQERAEIYLNE